MIQNILTMPQENEEKDPSEQLSSQDQLSENDKVSDKMDSKYFAVTDERRERFHHFLENQGKYNFSRPKVWKNNYKIDGHSFRIELSIKKSKAIKDEPTLWSMETIMPSDPNEFRVLFGSPEQKMKWDTNIKTFDRKVLSEEANGDHLAITNALADKYLGGAISPRQFTNVVHSKTIDAKTVESVSCTIDHEEFPVKSGYVKAWSTIYGLRVTEIESDELGAKYKVPELRDGDGNVLKWSKVELMFQADLRGNIPKFIIEKGTAKATSETFIVCRMFILRDIKGFTVLDK